MTTVQAIGMVGGLLAVMASEEAAWQAFMEAGCEEGSPQELAWEAALAAEQSYRAENGLLKVKVKFQ